MAQNAPQMTARELFYAAAKPEAKPEAKPATPAAPPKRKAPAAKPQERVETASNKPPAPKPGVATPAAPVQPPSNQPESGLIINASMRTSAPPPASGTALGLKYTVLELEGSSMVPVAPGTIFHAHDKIQFSIETNGPGYLYIVARGSSGEWKPMFPAPEIADGDNRIEGFHDYTFPNGYRYAFDELAGDERFFLILSRDPKPDFEQLVYSLKDRPVTPANDAKPAAPQAAPQHKTLMAANIEDSTITRFRNAYARDLVIEKIGDEPNTNSKEKATFVVNATGASDSCVVAEFSLAHR
jgi:hypothetical protein